MDVSVEAHDGPVRGTGTNVLGQYTLELTKAKRFGVPLGSMWSGLKESTAIQRMLGRRGACSTGASER
jgi:hypothetical protein